MPWPGQAPVYASVVDGSYVDEVLAYASVVDGLTSTYFVHSNHLYSPAAVTSSAGSVVERYKYDAYGRQTVMAADGMLLTKSNVGFDRGFTGYVADIETGLCYARARMYSAEMGRFLSRDPYGINLKKPETGHPYAFAVSNPMVFSDPTGLFTLVELTSVQSIQTNLRGTMTQYMKSEIKERIHGAAIDAATDFFLSSLDALSGGKLYNLMRGGGKLFESDYGKTLRDQYSPFAEDKHTGGLDFYWGVAVDPASGKPLDDGFNIEDFGAILEDSMPNLGAPRPDLIASTSTPSQIASGHGKALFISDLKVSGNVLWQKYVSERPSRQFQAINIFARRYTSTRMGVFICFSYGEDWKMQAVKQLLISEGLGNGVVYFMAYISGSNR